MSKAQSTERRRSPNKRVPLGVPRQKMTTPSKPGYVRRWINDHNNRIQRAQQAGWEFVTDPNLHVGENVESGDRSDGSMKRMPVGTQEGGSPLYAYLMEIPREYYDEDQQAKQQKVDEIDAAIKGGNTTGKTGDSAFYGEAKFRSSTEE